MSDKKWSTWFIASVIWMFANIFVFTVATDAQRAQITNNWLFMLGVWLSCINLVFSLYVGSIKDDKQ